MMDKELLIKQKQEAIKRLEEFESRMNFNQNIKKYFEIDKLYYSYLTAGGMIGSVDNINYDNRYSDVVKQFEQNGSLVYHCIETSDSLALLFVSVYEEEWPSERLLENNVLAYVHNFSNPMHPDMGDITISSFADSGALIRIG